MKLLNRFRAKRNLVPVVHPILANAIKFVINEVVTGDYYEFGVFRGQNLAAAVKEFDRQAARRLSAGPSLGDSDRSTEVRRALVQNIKFHAFDSFLGLPRLEAADSGSEDFSAGQFECSKDDFLRNLKAFGVDLNRVHVHEGWFSDVLERTELLHYPPASIIWLDCDLYSSARDALNICSSILQDGTIIVIDDWFSYKGSKYRGVQRAFYEWADSPLVSTRFSFNPYQFSGWKRFSFIANAISP